MKRITHWFLLFGIVFALEFASQCLAQETKPKSQTGAKTEKAAETPRKTAPPKTAPDLTEWKSLLDHLAVEARTLDSEEDPNLLIAEVADAYWRFDPKRAKTLFTDAFDRASATPGSQASMREILTLVAKRDRRLVISMTKQLAESRNNEKPDVFRVSRELLDTDQALAVEMAQTAASLGPSMGGLFFLFKLVEKNPAAADQLYELYLKQLSARGSPPLSSVLWLAGYPFGYGEAWGGSNNPLEFAGFGALRREKLGPNPNLARAYLQLAFGSVTDTLREAAAIPDPNARDELNGLALFATAYLFPETRTYLPAAEGAWSGLYRQALTATSESRKAAIEARLQKFLEMRARGMKSAEDYLAGEASAKSDEISKQPDGCKRDRARAELALNVANTNKFAEARQIADQIEDVSLRDNVFQFLNYGIADAAIEAGNLFEAASLAEKVTAKNERALLLVKIAGVSITKGDKSGALDLLNRARSLVGDAEPELQIDVLLGVANVYVRFDALEAVMVLRDGIKAINRAKNAAIEPFSVFRQVPLSCPGELSFYGSREYADTSGLYETLAAIANSSVQGQEALLIASELENKATRLRAQLSIVKAVLKDK
jgi:hypothetical protein